MPNSQRKKNVDAKQMLLTSKKKIDAALKVFLGAKVKHAKKNGKLASALIAELCNFTLRAGKRVRPTFFMYGFKCIKPAKEKDLLKASLSIELIESFLLIHDDVMDQDPFRRNGKAYHKVFEGEFKKRFKKGDAQHYGYSMAIMAGDIAQSYGNELLMDSAFPLLNRKKAIDKLNEIITYTCFGQVLDITFEHASQFNEKDIERIHELKTAWYTILGPLQLGAVLAGANNKQLRALHHYGLNIGKAFQIQDDILGMFGEEKKLGKPSDSDLREGKKTLLIWHALKNASPSQKKILNNALGNPNLTKAQANATRKIIQDAGSLAYSRNKVQASITKALHALHSSGFRSEGIVFLKNITDYMLNREY